MLILHVFLQFQDGPLRRRQQLCGLSGTSQAMTYVCDFGGTTPMLFPAGGMPIMRSLLVTVQSTKSLNTAQRCI
jgi:hypothetical protein